jgi:hypothetical protein
VVEIPMLDGSLPELAARFQVPLKAAPDHPRRLLAEIDQRSAAEAALWRALLGGFYATAAEAKDLVQECQALAQRRVIALAALDRQEAGL